MGRGIVRCINFRPWKAFAALAALLVGVVAESGAQDETSDSEKAEIKELFMKEMAAQFSKREAAESKRQSEVEQSINWQTGPTVASMDDIAEIRVPQGYRFTGAEGAKSLSTLTRNPPDPLEIGAIARQGELNWLLSFRFDPIGYVPDEGLHDLDENSILMSLCHANDSVNAERNRRDGAPININGWIIPPTYEASTNNLVWAVRAVCAGDGLIIHNTRILGRDGVMRVSLVAGAKEFNAMQSTLQELLSGFSYKPGRRYEDFTKGDKIAGYGAIRLITGADAAPRPKKELLPWLLQAFIASLILTAVVGGAIQLRNAFK